MQYMLLTSSSGLNPTPAEAGIAVHSITTFTFFLYLGNTGSK